MLAEGLLSFNVLVQATYLCVCGEMCVRVCVALLSYGVSRSLLFSFV